MDTICFRRDLKTKIGKYTKTETENISKLTAYINQLMSLGLFFVFFRFYTVFVFSLRIILETLLFYDYSKLKNIREQDKSP